MTRPKAVTAATLLLVAKALVAAAYGLSSPEALRLIVVFVMGLIAWGVWRGSELARMFVWLFAFLAVVTLGLEIVGFIQRGTVPVGWAAVLGLAVDLATIAAGVLVGRPDAHDFFMARGGRRRRSARVENLDD
jgi:hypothetical protein